jgi:hypothetical protein
MVIGWANPGKPGMFRYSLLFSFADHFSRHDDFQDIRLHLHVPSSGLRRRSEGCALHE